MEVMQQNFVSASQSLQQLVVETQARRVHCAGRSVRSAVIKDAVRCDDSRDVTFKRIPQLHRAFERSR